MKRFLALIALSSVALAAPPPVNIQALNGSYRPITPVAIVDANGDQITSFAGGGSGGGGGGAITAAAGAIVDMGTGASPGANTLNGRLASLLSAQQATTTALGSLSITNTGFAVTNTPTVNLGTLNGAATAARQDSLLAALGSPLQQNGGSVSLSGSLPAFAATPTFNIGTAPTLAVNDNLTQIAGTAVATGAGASNAGTLRVILSSDSPVGGGGGSSSAVAQGSSTSGQVGGLTQGAVTAAAPSYTTGQTNPLSLTVTGALRTDGSGVTQPVSLASAPLPTGAATAAAQTGTGAAAQTVQGATASGSANAGAPVKIGCVYQATVSNYTSGNVGDAQCGQKGEMLTQLSSSGIPATQLADQSDTVSTGSSTNGLKVVARSTVYNGTTWDRQRGDVNGTYSVATPTAVAANGIVPATVANASSQVGKASAGNVYGLNIENAAVTGTYAIIYNATAAPAAGGALTASLILWHAIMSSSGTIDKVFPIPAVASAGIVVLYSTSLTTFTAPATAPLLSTVMVK